MMWEDGCRHGRGESGRGRPGGEDVGDEIVERESRTSVGAGLGSCFSWQLLTMAGVWGRGRLGGQGWCLMRGVEGGRSAWAAWLCRSDDGSGFVGRG